MKRRDTIVRYTAPERINHWITAFCFVLAAVSGLGFLFPSFNWLMHIMGTPQLARIVHPVRGRDHVRLIHHHVFPLLAPQSNQSG
ncbi:formate dehydrogenase-O subunit gamma [Citrobacter koseri]|uniref:Formate dehydrogenase-O subunit gamma n=1 Tax=Citrobacter koseri TaxID=545 RepID=A0A2X2WVF4_CITKO|nr:formate dehydrogenase-O subunit gamma [Citrobacter koseri]